jgi:hypothetical protein
MLLSKGENKISENGVNVDNSVTSRERMRSRCGESRTGKTEELLDEALRILAERRLMGECSADLLVWYGNRQHSKRKEMVRALGVRE